MPIIAPYGNDDGEQPRPCERAVLTSGTRYLAAIVLRDENDKHHFLCFAHAAQHFERQSGVARKRPYERLGVRRLVDHREMQKVSGATGVKGQGSVGR
jgi:hypothetical protein